MSMTESIEAFTEQDVGREFEVIADDPKDKHGLAIGARVKLIRHDPFTVGRQKTWGRFEGSGAMYLAPADVRRLSPAPVEEPGRFPPPAIGQVWHYANGIRPRDIVLKAPPTPETADCWEAEDGGWFEPASFTNGKLTFVRHGSSQALKGEAGVAGDVWKWNGEGLQREWTLTERTEADDGWYCNAPGLGLGIIADDDIRHGEYVFIRHASPAAPPKPTPVIPRGESGAGIALTCCTPARTCRLHRTEALVTYVNAEGWDLLPEWNEPRGARRP